MKMKKRAFVACVVAVATERDPPAWGAAILAAGGRFAIAPLATMW